MQMKMKTVVAVCGGGLASQKTREQVATTFPWCRLASVATVARCGFEISTCTANLELFLLAALDSY